MRKVEITLNHIVEIFLTGEGLERVLPGCDVGHGGVGCEPEDAPVVGAEVVHLDQSDTSIVVT